MCNKIGSYNHSQFQQLSSDQSDSEINGMTGTTGVPDGPSNNSITLTTSNCDYIDTQHKCTESTSVTLNIQENKNHEEKKKSICPCKIPVNPGSRNPTVSENKKYACQILNQVKAQFGTASDKKPDVSQIPAQVLAQLKSNPTTRKCQLVRVYEVAESKKNNDSGKIPTARAARTRRPEPYPTRAADCNLKKCKTDTVFSGELNHLFCNVISLTNAFQCKYLSRKSRINMQKMQHSKWAWPWTGVFILVCQMMS